MGWRRTKAMETITTTSCVIILLLARKMQISERRAGQFWVESSIWTRGFYKTLLDLIHSTFYIMMEHSSWNHCMTRSVSSMSQREGQGQEDHPPAQEEVEEI
jgi:hypothetical protein